METKQGYFDAKMPYPLDLRQYKATYADILTIPQGARYIGMEIFAYTEGGWWQFKDGITDPDLVPSERGGAEAEGKSFIWAWSDGIDVGGTHLDFVISPATAGEISSIDSSILFVGGSVQVSNFTIETTTVDDDTIRILGTAGEREGTVEVVLFYGRAVTGIPRSLLQLDDTPNDYSGEAIRTLKVNDVESAMEYGYGFWKGTQAEYDALGAPQKADTNIIHFIIEP